MRRQESTALVIARLAAVGAGSLVSDEVVATHPIRLTLAQKLSAADRTADRSAW